MEEANVVKVHGVGANPYSKRVELALRIKGITYEYIEEDMSNKSQLLLNYNPVYKKIPVLVHNEKPVVESLIILECIDETWKNNPRLLPADPFQRAKVHFWANFILHELFGAMARVFTCEGEVQAKAIDEVNEKMKVVEEGMKESFPGSSGSASIEIENFGLLDILICSIFNLYKAYEEVLGVKLLDPEKKPIGIQLGENLERAAFGRRAIPPT